MKATKPLMGGAVSFRPFRKTGQGVFGNGKVKDLRSVAVAKASVRR